MKTIPLYVIVNPGFEQSPLTLGVTVRGHLKALLADGSWTLLSNSYGAVVVARQDVFDALLSDELTEERTYIVSRAALQAEDCAIDASTAEPFTDTYFARIDVGCFASRPTLYRFTIHLGEPPAGAQYKNLLVVDGEQERAER